MEKRKKTKKVKTDMPRVRFAEGGNVRSIGKRSGESVESAVKKKKGKATVGRIAEKDYFQPGIKE